MTDAPRGLRLLDLIALVASYGLAALLIRAFWPHDGMPSATAGAFVAVVYAWLGLAMGGPLVLLIDRRQAPLAQEGQAVGSARRYTWAETAWLMIGAYWIGLALLVVPTRIPIHPLLGVFPVLAALLMRFFAPARKAEVATSSGWTHATGIAVLLTWPLAWIAMIALGGTL